MRDEGCVLLNHAATEPSPGGRGQGEGEMLPYFTCWTGEIRPLLPGEGDGGAWAKRCRAPLVEGLAAILDKMRYNMRKERLIFHSPFLFLIRQGGA